MNPAPENTKDTRTDTADRAVVTLDEPSAARPDAVGVKVLLVEDDPALRRSLVRELGRSFAQVHATESAEHALELLANTRYDVVVTDLGLTGLNGIGLVARIADEFPALPCVLISGIATARDYEAARQAGAVSVLCKPFESDALRSAICDAAERADGFQGELHGLTLVDVLQSYHYSRRSVLLRVGAHGLIAMADGEIVHAAVGARSGELALREILSHQSGQIRSSALTPGPVTVRRAFQGVVLDSLRQLDEIGVDPEAQLELEQVERRSERAAIASTWPESNAGGFRVHQTDSLASLCASLVNGTEGVLGCLAADLATGVVLGVASATNEKDLLRDPIVSWLLATFGLRGGRPNAKLENRELGAVDEMYMGAASRHYLAMTVSGTSGVVLLLTDRAVRVGMVRVWATHLVKQLASHYAQ